ncbi:TlpA disulfide reductase family protein [Luteimonas vadosa]|uniref:TlpA disulfide reductase family protein n=1 Tax=Luteimonas vadosa TaxID=1165507 RepID=A0ABP9EF57_9GAMM
MPLRLLCLILLPMMLAACQRDDAPPVPDASVANLETATTKAEPDPAASPRQDSGKIVEAEIPTLELTALDGSTYDLAARRGKWVVVNFWATWCAPCLKEMPELSALDAMREHVEVVGLAYEDIDPEAMRAFLEKHPVVYPIVLLDVYDPPADFASPRGLPMTYLIAPDGRVAKKFLGPVTAIEIETAIAAAGGPEAPKA